MITIAILLVVFLVGHLKLYYDHALGWPKFRVCVQKTPESIFKMVKKNIMKLDLEELKNFDRILVTGANRSGTTFISVYLANKLNYTLVDEKQYQYKERVFNFFFSKKRVVIQGPGMCYASHRICSNFSNSIVVYMKRDLGDIGASSERIRPDLTREERFKGFQKVKSRFAGEPELRQFVAAFDPPLESFGPESSALFRYSIWDEFQKNRCENWMEINYEDLEGLEGYITPNKRKLFKPKQTEEQEIFKLMLELLKRVKHKIIFKFLIGYTKIVSRSKSSGL